MPSQGAVSGQNAIARRWWVLAVIGVVQLMVVLDATIVNIALPSAQEDLGFSDGDRQWVVTAYTLAFGSLLLLGGRIGDLIGRKQAFLLGLVGFAAASALGGAAEGFGMLVAARAVQGVFGALLAPAALSLLTTTFTEPKERAKAFAVFGAVAGTGSAIGLLLGGLLTEYLNWRWCLYINVAFAAAGFVGGLLLLPRTVRGRARPAFDIPGILLAATGLFSLVYGFSNAERESWSAGSTYGFLAAAVVLLALFAWWQTRAAHPLLPLRILLNRNRGASYVSLLVAAAGMFGASLFLTYFLQSSLGYSPMKTGVAFLPMIVAMVFTTVPTQNAVLPRVGPRPLVPLGMALAAGSLLWLSSLELGSGYASHVLGPLILLGMGLGLVMPCAMNVATFGVQPTDAGAASATVNTMQQIGASVGTALLNTLATTAGTDYLAGREPSARVLAESRVEGYTTAFAWSVAIFATGLVLSATLYRSGRLRPQPGPTADAAPAPAA
ncbi:MFS transporter [Streptomyces physcomitrii]|uniref:MFS transporter n=1 Tax=Streptomyces physcomitrii TaxID=2724184 RepID=UPI003424D2CE